MKITLALLALLLPGCTPQESMEPDVVIHEVRSMFNDYELSVERDGLMAEFAFLDSSADFFWVPPGYSSALSYDSVRSIVTQNASQSRSITLAWDTLRIIPLSRTVAAYTGILQWNSEGPAGIPERTTLIETGVVVRRGETWKILCGQTRNSDVR
jgi:hypothetical protein